MISIPSVVQNIVEFNLRESEHNASMIISSEINFSEWFEKPITDAEVLELEVEFPMLSFTNDGIDARLDLNFLFVNRQGYYSCFYNNTDHNPLWKNETKWDFTSNHDTCWRDSAFTTSQDDIYEIRAAICKISTELYPLEHINIPKHVIPNFSSISNTDKFTFDEISTKEDYRSNKHILELSKEGTFFKISEENVVV